MEPRDNRIENLEGILRSLLDILALTPSSQPHHFRLWLDLAITETRAQLARAKSGTLH
jgi:hypothetical protein